MDGIPRLIVSNERRQGFEDNCDALIQRALEEHHSFHTANQVDTRWKLVRQRDTLSVYKDRNSNLMLGSGFLQGTLDDTMLGVYCDTTDNMRVVKSILSPNTIDATMVHVFEKNTIQSPIIFSGIKAFAIETPGGQFVHNRDVVCFERMGRIVDMENNYFAYHTLQSIDLKEYPESRHFKRANLKLCYLYRQLSEKWVGCFMMGQYEDSNGKLPQSISDIVVANTMLTVGNVLECAQAKRFLHLMLNSNSVNAKPMSKTCQICQDKPGLLERSLMECVGCKNRVCKKCRVHCVVFKLNMRSRRPEREWFCIQCVDQVGSPQKPSGQYPETPDHSSPSSDSGSIRSDAESRLYALDSDLIAELTGNWSNSGSKQNPKWNIEELTRLATRLQKKDLKKSKSNLSRSHIGLSRSKSSLGSSRIQSTSNPDLSKSTISPKKPPRSAPLDRTPGPIPNRHVPDNNPIPGNSYSGGALDWRTSAARLNQQVGDGADMTASFISSSSTRPSSSRPSSNQMRQSSNVPVRPSYTTPSVRSTYIDSEPPVQSPYVDPEPPVRSSYMDPEPVRSTYIDPEPVRSTYIDPEPPIRNSYMDPEPYMNHEPVRSSYMNQPPPPPPPRAAPFSQSMGPGSHEQFDRPNFAASTGPQRRPPPPPPPPQSEEEMKELYAQFLQAQQQEMEDRDSYSSDEGRGKAFSIDELD